MDVLLVGAELEENLAVRYLAACLERAGHTARAVRFDGPSDEGAVVAAVGAERPALVGLSLAFQRRAREFGALAQALREAGFRGHLTAGGHFPTFAFRELMAAYPAFDSVVRHEGEVTLVELVAALTAGGAAEPWRLVDGLAYRLDDGSVVANPARPLAPDLDALPLPKRLGEPQVHLGIPAAFLVGSRGCYGHCTFCCIHAFVRDAGGPRYRQRSAANLATEIAELRRTRGARMFVFHDDDFFTRDHTRDLARVTALRDELRARHIDDIALVVKARPDDLDAEVFDVLAEIGLLRVYLGVEAGSSQGLRTLGRGVDVAQNRRALDFLRRRDVYTCYNMLLFDPDTTVASLRASLALWRDHAEVPMNFCRAEIYVGTPLMQRLAREGRLHGDVFGWDYEIAEPAAERAFRLFARVFHDRNFRCDGLMNSSLGLGYHLHLLRHFYPHAFGRELRDRTTEVVRRINLDCIERMGRILHFAESPASRAAAAREEFATRLVEETARVDRQLEADVAAATERIVLAARGKASRAVPLWRSVAAATLALSPLACDPLMPPPPPDPVPPPEETDDGGVLVPSGDDTGPSRFAEPPPGTSTATEPVVVDPVPPPPDPLPPPTSTIHVVDPAPPPTRRPVLPPPDPPPPPHERQR